MLKGKVALATGSTSGIGYAMAERLAAVGANMVLHGQLDPANGRALVREFESRLGIQCLFSDANIATAEGTRRWWLGRY